MQRILGEVAFAAGLAVTLWLVGHLGLQPVEQALARVGVAGVLLLALAHAPTLVTLGLCWALLAGEASEARRARYVWGRSVRDAAGVLLPFSAVAGYVLGVRAVVLTGAAGAQAAVSGLVDMAAEQLARAPYMVLSVACLMWLAPGRPLTPAILMLLAATVAIAVAAGLRWDLLRGQLVKLAVRLSRYWPGAAAEKAKAEATLCAALARGRRFWLGMGLQFAGWLLGAAEAWLALRLLGAHLGYGEAMAIDGVYTAIRIFAFVVPAAIGVQEASYVALCGVFGVEAPTALAFSLTCRARDLLISAPPLLVWQFLEREKRRSRTARIA